MIRRIAVLIAIFALASVTSALAAVPAEGECTLVSLHGEASPRNGPDQQADSGNVQDPTGVCHTLSSLRGS
jgi:hypothetical protein